MIQSAVALNSDAVKALLRDHRTREDVLEAVLALHESGRAAHAIGESAAASDLANVFRWADALARLLESGDGLVLLAGYRQADALLVAAAVNAEEGARYDEKPQPRLYRHKEERELAIALALSRREAFAALDGGDYDLAMRAIAALRPFVQAFFRKVEFDAALTDLRENRLRLLHELRATLGLVGNLAKVEGEVVGA
jgi:glycyl-tRNA synthetase beta chain